jgi:hypothetical protein
LTKVIPCFPQNTGLMGIETPLELGGAGSNFTAAIVVIEELAKVDPAVSVVCGIYLYTLHPKTFKIPWSIRCSKNTRQKNNKKNIYPCWLLKKWDAFVYQKQGLDQMVF